MNRTQPGAGDRVQHICTGDVGTLDRFVRQDQWALVRWDAVGPGMVGDDGLSYVAPTLLVRHPEATR